jgi:hypothetical protein
MSDTAVARGGGGDRGERRPWVGRLGPNRPEMLGPDARISKETIYPTKVNRAEMKN